MVSITLLRHHSTASNKKICAREDRRVKMSCSHAKKIDVKYHNMSRSDLYTCFSACSWRRSRSSFLRTRMVNSGIVIIDMAIQAHCTPKFKPTKE